MKPAILAVRAASNSCEPGFNGNDRQGSCVCARCGQVQHTFNATLMNTKEKSTSMTQHTSHGRLVRSLSDCRTCFERDNGEALLYRYGSVSVADGRSTEQFKARLADNRTTAQCPVYTDSTRLLNLAQIPHRTNYAVTSVHRRTSTSMSVSI